ncbi:TonB-dependent receptor [Pedobacter nyackensis]|nr:TonB-dependent receptor [Pedobacter nyackensis]
MKLIAIILTVVSLHASASAFSQINIAVKNSPIERVLKEIKKQSGYSIFYDADYLATAKPVNLNLNNASLAESLKRCFEGQPFTYQIFSNTIVIKALNPVPEQRDVVIAGKVTDENGEPLPGVTVKVKGSSTVVLTNSMGLYSVRVVNNKAILIFSFLGFSTQEVAINGRTAVNIKMVEEVGKLNQVVVIGYGSVNRKDLTGSVASVNISDFAKAPVTSFDEALAGRVAGVTVAGADGQPGSVNNIVIRGPGSITQDNSPLFVVDGFPLEDADNSFINPDNIESIDILKDASSTAIYGSRGANGVIIITTKRGKKGDPVINFNSYYGIQKNTNVMELLSPYEFVKVQLEQSKNLSPNYGAIIYTPGSLPITSPDYIEGGNTLESYRNVKGTYIQDEYFRKAGVQNYDISLRGGTDKTLYAISANVRDMEGIIINSGFKRYMGSLSLDQYVKKSLKVGTNLSYNKNKTYGTIQIPAGGSFNSTLSHMYSVWGYRPVTGNEDLSLDQELFDPVVAGDDYRVNPVISAKNEIRNANVSGFYANLYAELAILQNLKLRVTGAITNKLTSNESFNNSMTSSGNASNTTRKVNGSVVDVYGTNLLNENTLTYSKLFNKVHSINAVAGFTMQKNEVSSRGFSASLVPNEELVLDGLDEALTQVISSSSTRWGLASYLSRFNYSYKSKYLLTASFRADGSSKFTRDNRWGYFPSAAASWVVSQEDFIKKLNYISTLKLRLSYGLTGNNRIGDFEYLTRLNFPNSNGYAYNNSSPSKGTVISSIGNPGLKWETTMQTDAGIDIGLFKERVSLTVDVYDKVTKNLLLNADLPLTTGVGTAFKNVGKMQNRGLEISLNTVNIKNKVFSWASNFNISFNENKVLSLSENQNALTRRVRFDDAWGGVFSYISMVNEPLGQMYGLIWEGVYPVSDFDVNGSGTYVLKASVPTNGTARASIQPGYIKYKDLNDDGIINISDYTIIGRGLPKHTGGFSNNFRFKGFDLNVLLQWSYGNDLINANKLIFEGSSRRSLNQFASFADRWSFENQDSTIPVVNGNGPANYSTRLIEDGSYLRLKTVSLGYNLPTAFLKKHGISSVRVYSSAQNLYTWTNYTGPDPEVSVGFTNLTQGFDYAAYPRARTITFGLNVSF